MASLAISGSIGSSYANQTVQNNLQQFRQDFQQLGQDLKAGNLSAAQQDFVTLQQLAPQPNSTAAQSNNPIVQAFNQLSQDLQSGNLSAAQQDFTNIQQDFQNQGAQGTHHHHRHGGKGGSSEISQLFNQLGQALQSGNLTSAQQSYAALQQDLQQFGVNTGSTATQPNAVSVTA